LLIQHFIARFGGATVTGCTPAAASALVAYQYPGNVRQLQHVVQRAVAVARAELIDLDDLPEEVVATRATVTAAQEGSVAAARERAEREMIIATLARNNGEVSSAAREMQVSRTTMWRLMKKHGISA
jgi:transcriptional regulator of acetoin/glycerol metabolism